MSQDIYEKNYLDYYDPNKCLGDLGEKWCTFKWFIYNIHLTPLETFQSPMFTTRLLQNTSWYLEARLSPPGKLETMDISLRRLRSNENIRSTIDVIFKIIVDEEVKISDKRTLEYNDETPSNDVYSYRASISKLEKNCVTVECKLRPNKTMITKVYHGDIDETLSACYRNLLQSGNLCDTIIQVGNHQFMAHLYILLVRLPDMAKLAAPTENGKHVIEINNLPVTVVKELLKYAYTGQAYLDLESVSVDSDILDSYHPTFLQNFSWADHPFATTSFNYETDSLSWNLNGVSTKSSLGSKCIQLLQLSQNKIEFSLDVSGSEEEEKVLSLTFKLISGKITKSTKVFCNCYSVNLESNEAYQLGVREILFHPNTTAGKVELCSLLDINRGKSTLFAKDDILDLKMDFKFGYGSSKSDIENLHEGQFEISKCTGCELLSDDMKKLYWFGTSEDIIVKIVNGKERKAHKAILYARWSDAHKYYDEKSKCILIKNCNFIFRSLHEFITYLYAGNSTEQLKFKI